MNTANSAGISPGSPLTPRRLLMVTLMVVVTGWAGWTALREPNLPNFVASGDPIELPADRSFPSASLDEFEAILVGQRGRPVLVNIWASWCAPCRTEMPLLQSAADTYAGQVVILGVASNDDPDEAKAFLGELGLSYPNVFDTTGEIRVALGLTAYPTTYVFGADGTIRARVNGGISEQRLAGLIEDALG
ncbi:MAG: TlpA family protein disulfide reductase [Acidimicrobiales bacterium]|nr:TlpA family protein disulfide reductase [Acidimicrobiales bacterium]